MVIQEVVPDRPDQTLVVEQTLATLWAGVQVVPRLPKRAVSKRSGPSVPQSNNSPVYLGVVGGIPVAHQVSTVIPRPQSY
jgi:hypothetical protein